MKISPPPQAPTRQPAKRPSVRAIPPQDQRDPLTITVRYRGGNECWYEVKARGGTVRVQGWLGFHDLMQRLYAGDLYSD